MRGARFYLDDASAPALRSARARCCDAEDAIAAERASIAARLHEVCGVDVTSDEALVLRARDDGPLPDGLAVTRETSALRLVQIRVDATARDAALAQLTRAEVDARRELADAIARVPRDSA